MLEALKNGRLQVRKKFGLIGKRLKWIEDALCKQKFQPIRLRVATERMECAKRSIRSDGAQSDRMDAMENFLTFLKSRFLVSKLIGISFYTFIIT